MSDTKSAQSFIDDQVQKARLVTITDSQKQAILDAANGDAQKAALLENLLRTENRGFGYPKDVPSKRRAQGPWQFTGPAWLQFGEGDYSNAHDFTAGAKAASRMVDWISRKYSADPGVVGAYYNGGWRAADPVSVGMDPPSEESQNYVRIMRALSQPQAPEQADPIWTRHQRFQ